MPCSPPPLAPQIITYLLRPRCVSSVFSPINPATSFFIFVERCCISINKLIILYYIPRRWQQMMNMSYTNSGSMVNKTFFECLVCGCVCLCVCLLVMIFSCGLNKYKSIFGGSINARRGPFFYYKFGALRIGTLFQ